MDQASSRLRPAAFAAIALSPLASHAALAWGHGINVALALAGLQAMAAGLLLWMALPPRARALAIAAPVVMLGGLLAGAAHDRPTGLLVVAGLQHALFYACLFVVFVHSLRPGRVSVMTLVARWLNPHFRPGMIPYTRTVTFVWCIFFALQLILSASLLAWAPVGWWLLLVGTLHGPMAAGLTLAEFVVRHRRFPGEHTRLRDSFMAVRRAVAPSVPRTSAGTSSPAADCRERS